MPAFIGSDTVANLTKYFLFIHKRKNAIVYNSVDVYP